MSKRTKEKNKMEVIRKKHKTWLSHFDFSRFGNITIFSLEETSQALKLFCLFTTNWFDNAWKQEKEVEETFV